MPENQTMREKIQAAIDALTRLLPHADKLAEFGTLQAAVDATRQEHEAKSAALDAVTVGGVES